MALSVCVLFDPAGEHAVRAVWDQLEAQGVRTLATHTHGRHHPHLSYAVLLAWDLDRVTDALRALPEAGPFPLTFQGMLAFPRGRVALAPSVSVEVMQRQHAVTAALTAADVVLHHYYEPGRWVPHCSLSPHANRDALPVVANAVSDVLPLTVTAVRAALIDSGTGKTRMLPRLP